MNSPNIGSLGFRLLCGVLVLFHWSCPPIKTGGGGGDTTGTIDVAFACELPTAQNSPQSCDRSFTYTYTPSGTITGSGAKVTTSGSQALSSVGASAQINGNSAAIFSWVRTGLGFGTWNVSIMDNTGWSATNCAVTLTSGAPQRKVNVDNLRSGASACVVGDENNAAWP
jgi:hypothetical protein